MEISIANDVILIDYSKGKTYNECDYKENHTIMLNKSLSFYGFNGVAVLQCQQAHSFFGISSSDHSTLRVVFSNLSLATRGNFLDTTYNYTNFDLEINFCHIKESVHFVKAISISCSIQVLNSTIRSSLDPISVECNNLTINFARSTFYSCPIKLSSGVFSRLKSNGPNLISNILVYNCTFHTTKNPLYCDYFVRIILGTTTCNVTIQSSFFVNFNNPTEIQKSAALMISSNVLRRETTIILDTLQFENITCSSAVVNMHLLKNYVAKVFNVGIFNSKFVNTFRAFQCYIDQQMVIPYYLDKVKLYNNTFNNSHQKNEANLSFIDGGLIYLVSGFYHFSSCRIFNNVPGFNPDFPLIRVESSVIVMFENFSYKSYPIRETSGKHSNMYYIISYQTLDQYILVEGNFTISCPRGYNINSKTNRLQTKHPTTYNLFVAFCEQCQSKTYTLDEGIFRNNSSKRITCKPCPVGGYCVKGQVTSKKNFWGYVSNGTVQFLRCPPKYCCDTDHCKQFNSCHGKRMGTLCGRCPRNMSESLFDTKCNLNKNCSSACFWPTISVYLICYLLFFLYQEDILNFLVRRIFSRIFSSFRNSKPGGVMKIVFYYYQIVRLLRSSIASDGKVEMFDEIQEFFFRAFNFVIVTFPSCDCPFDDLKPVRKAIITHSVGYSLLIFSCLLYFSVLVLQKFKIKRTKQPGTHTQTTNLTPDQKMTQAPFFNRIVGAFTNIFLLMYNSSTQLCLSLLHCVPFRDEQVLFLDGATKCYQGFQYFFFAYMISSILPFCLVPIFGSYLLKLNLISVFQFCLACIFPLPFCFYWPCLLVRNSLWYRTHSCRVTADALADDESEGDNVNDSNCSVLHVLLGPFRTHKLTFVFPASRLPWEGFLLFRRLAVILVLTFVYDNPMKMTLTTILFVAIFLIHVLIRPFKATSDNVLESVSLGSLVIISVFSLVKSIYNGEDLDGRTRDLLNFMYVFENILIIFPIGVTLFSLMLAVFLKLIKSLALCFRAIHRSMRKANNGPSYVRTRNNERSEQME